MRTPSQTVGPFFSIGLQHLCDPAASEVGDHLRVRGRVLDGEGKGIPDAVLEVWPETDSPVDAAYGFQRIFTDENGAFTLVIAKPVTEATSHAVVCVFMRGLLRHLITRVYIRDSGRVDTDPVLTLVPPERRSTLIAMPTDSPSTFEWNIVMQGDSETVFFEC